MLVRLALVLVVLCLVHSATATQTDCCAVASPPAGCPGAYSCCPSLGGCFLLECSLANEMRRQGVATAGINAAVCMSHSLCSYCDMGMSDLSYVYLGTIGLWKLSSSWCKGALDLTCYLNYGSCVSCSTFKTSLVEQVKLFKYLYSADATFTNSNVWPSYVRSAYQSCRSYVTSC